MKSTLITLTVAIGLGALLGTGWSYYQYSYDEAFAYAKPALPTGPAPAVNTPSGQSPGRPRIQVEESNIFDFGVMSKEETRHHTFVVRNIGTATLRLQFIDKSCQCTEVKLSRSSVPPGETVDIALSWQPNSYNPEFNQTARFKTNDPGRIELDLTVRGRVQQIIRLIPSNVSFDDVMKDTDRDVTVMVYAYRDQDLSVDRVEWLDSSIAEHFDYELRRMTSAELASEPGAVGGTAIKLKLKPGLPIGGFWQQARLRFAQDAHEPIEIPVVGSIVGNVSVIHPRYDQIDKAIELGTLRQDEPHTSTAWLLIKGIEAPQLDLQVSQVDPSEVLRATLGEPTKQGRTWRVPLHIEIVPTERTIKRLGAPLGDPGKITLESPLPEIERIVVPITFATEGAIDS